ncbi:MAG: hypothetical protein A3F13_04925 [Gammaproteobacteria bacterium RIFCSPHIGHO2_12_FULL_40_19]|nr:MAG: hypothetical protein A3F13_04925 [Gammaproteobacteria bacterium RIFCSPHIGHO2_12_FULL_40_19]HLB41997.1 hypothetical protein [Gammaproteobacteria bacterium]
MAKKKTVGILNKGKDNKFENNEFEGLDVGIEDRGERTTAKGNIFRWLSQQHLAEKWHQKWWMKLLLSLAIFLIGSYLVYYFGWS